MAENAIADFEAAGSGPQRGDASGKFGGGRKRQRRLDLVFVLDDQQIEEIEAGVADVDQRFALAGDRIGQVDNP